MVKLSYAKHLLKVNIYKSMPKIRFHIKFVKVMESNGNGDSFVSCSSKDEKVNEAVDDLLEECWFFENLLKKRSTMMLRCNSDPCPSSSSNISFTEKHKGDGVAHRCLIRAPSLPPCIGRKEEKQEKDGTRKLTGQSSQLKNGPELEVSGIMDFGEDSMYEIMIQASKLPSCNKEKESTSSSRSKFVGQSRCRKLQKAPSMPTNIGREEDISCQENDSDARMSRLIQLAFANSTESLLPRHSSKGLIQSYSIQKARRPPRSSEVESSNNTNGIKEMNRRYLNQQKMIRKSLNDLETEEVQGFKDLGFTFEKKDLSPSVVSILPGLQEKKQEEISQDNKMRRPYLSEAWLVQSCAPPIPNCVPESNSAEDMKAQLKFWARAVASNVR